VDDGQNVYPIGLYSVDDPIRFFDDLPDIFRVILGYRGAGEGVVDDLFGTAGDFVHHRLA